MPDLRRYKKNSIIYFDEDAKSRHAYLLKKGVCIRRKISAETGEPEVSRLAVGEFFGAKSALGNFRRDETVEVKEDSVVYVFSPGEFEMILKKNPSIIFKILRIFSNELRTIHKAIEAILRGDDNSGVVSNNESLREMGDYYHQKKDFVKSLYIYQKYLEMVQVSSYKDEVKSKILDAQESLTEGL